MTYLVLFNNYDIRQKDAQYLWILHIALAHKLDAHYLLNKEYLLNINREMGGPEVVRFKKKWGSSSELTKSLTPNKYTVLPKAEDLIDSKGLCPSEILRYVTSCEDIPKQVEAIERVLKEKKIKAGLTWVNNKCFKKVLNDRGIPVIHHELGPFRPSTYIPTVYVDFSGVNGDTEFDTRFKEFLKVADRVPILSREELIKILSPRQSDRLLSILKEKKREYETGVGLQVEVDTNLLLFNNGRSWIDPVLKAQADSSGKVLVRPHPVAGYTLKNSLRIDVDDITKGDALDFINKCDKIYCLNSSIGIEAMLLGRKAEILGENPFYSLQFMNEETLIKALNFAVFGYLTHRNFLFEDDYYTFRLNCRGNEKEIYLENMKRMLKEIRK